MSILSDIRNSVRSHIVPAKLDLATEQPHIQLSEEVPDAPAPSPKPRTRRLPKSAPTPEPVISANSGAAQQASITRATPDEHAPLEKVSKGEHVLRLLRSDRGAALSEIMDATSWQAHSVRGFLSGTVRKKLGLNLVCDVSVEGVRRYRIDAGEIIDRSKDAGRPSLGLKSADRTSVEPSNEQVG